MMARLFARVSISDRSVDMSSQETRPAIDFLSPAFHIDPWATYQWMRNNEPVYRDETNSLWGISTHADIIDVERRNTIFSSAHGYRSVEADGEDNIIAIDEPRHRAQRALVSKRFTPAAAREQRPWIDARIAELCAGPLERGRMEVVSELAGPLPAMWIAETLGFGAERWPEVQSWSERMAFHDSLEAGSERDIAAGNAVHEMTMAVRELLSQLDGCPMDSLIPTWVDAMVDGQPLHYQTVLWETLLFIVGGAETTRTALVHGLHAFAEHPEQWERLYHEPDLINTAVDEVVRWVTPLNNMFRTALVDTTIGDTAISRGDRVILLYPSANRDSAVFDHPDGFDIARNPNRHLGFGHGVHHCIGANTARAELAGVLTYLSQRITRLDFTAPPDIEPNVFTRSVPKYEITFELR